MGPNKGVWTWDLFLTCACNPPTLCVHTHSHIHSCTHTQRPPCVKGDLVVVAHCCKLLVGGLDYKVAEVVHLALLQAVVKPVSRLAPEAALDLSALWGEWGHSTAQHSMAQHELGDDCTPDIILASASACPPSLLSSLPLQPRNCLSLTIASASSTSNTLFSTLPLLKVRSRLLRVTMALITH